MGSKSCICTSVLSACSASQQHYLKGVIEGKRRKFPLLVGNNLIKREAVSFAPSLVSGCWFEDMILER